MNPSLFTFKPHIVKDIYIKDPLTSEIGKDIIRKSNDMIALLGFESFTFKKLAIEIQSTEATIYRYFENKQKILLYLTSYYWSQIEFKLMIKNTNINDDIIRLRNAVETVCYPGDSLDEWINQKNLFFNIINESSKSYMTKSVDNLNHNGVYYNYKKMVGIISDIILDIRPDYLYSHMLVTTIIEGIHHQIFFAEHLPSLTDKRPDKEYLVHFYFDLAIAILKK
ncbi:MAG: TetR/AcrR family transcriptional regulator [Saprospiraceae bacterium]